MGATNGHEPKNGKPFPIALMPLPDGLSIACQRILANSGVCGNCLADGHQLRAAAGIRADLVEVSGLRLSQ